MSLTPEQTQNYICNLGMKCPYCNSTEIGSVTLRPRHIPHAMHMMTEQVKCCDCKKSWFETYTLSYVESVEDHDGKKQR